MSNDLTIRCRIMYPHVHAPHKFTPEDAPMYLATLVVDEKDPQIQQVVNVTNKIIAEKLDGVQPDAANYPLKVDPDNAAVAGCYLIKAKSKGKPSVVEQTPNQGLQPIMTDARPEDGDWCYVSIRLYDYNTKGNKGVSAALNGVMFAEKGSGRLGKGGPSVDDMFGGVAAPPASGPPVAAPQGSTPPPANPFGG